MANEVTLDALLEKQKAMTGLAEQMIGESDTTRLQEMAAALQAQGEELTAMARQLEEQQAARSRRASTEVKLTPAQKERVLAATGVHLDSILLRDDAGIATRTMPATDPRVIEHWALLEARRIKVGREADAVVKARLAEAFAAIESQGNETLSEQLARMKTDPAFFGGILKQ